VLYRKEKIGDINENTRPAWSCSLRHWAELSACQRAVTCYLSINRVECFSLPPAACQTKFTSESLQGKSKMDNLLHSKAESARILGVSERLLHKLLSTKQLKCRRIARRVLISRDELLRFAKQFTK
jgi:hypothetical protein